VLHLGRRQCLGEDISHHVISEAVNEFDRTLLNNLADPVIMHIDVLGLWMVLVVAYECNGGLVIRKESGGGSEVTEDLRDKAVKLKGFLAAMYFCNVLALGGRQRNNILLL
jgi:hypothetical protein